MKPLALLLTLIALAGCHSKETKPIRNATPVRVASVDVYQPKSSARYSASIHPVRQVNLAFRVSGFVRDLHRMGHRGLEPGDIVAAGTILARLRPEEFSYSTRQAGSQLAAAQEARRVAEAQLAQAQANRAKADADFARAQSLYDSASLTRQEYDASRAQRDVAAAQVVAAQANVDSAGASIRSAEGGLGTARLAEQDTALIAPFTGAVVQRAVETGMLTGPSQVAYTIADLSTVKAVFGVPDTVVVQLQPGRRIDIRAEALAGLAFTGRVSSIAATADAETRLFQVEVEIANSKRLLRPGMIASLLLEEGAPSQPVPVIPLSAVVRDRANPADFAVMVVEGKTAKARKVALGPTYGELLAVTQGVRPGELVIRAGGTLVHDGDAVEILR
jgi:RND family efflux transporter MFP subunit